jgi:hypothetical protein
MAQERGYQGMVAKDPRSTYRSGRTRSWVKVKVRHDDVFVLGGIRNVDAFDGVLFSEVSLEKREIGTPCLVEADSRGSASAPSVVLRALPQWYSAKPVLTGGGICN